MTRAIPATHQHWFVVVIFLGLAGAKLHVAATCTPIDVNYNVSLPYDLGIHVGTASYESFWYSGVLDTGKGTGFGFSVNVDRCANDCGDFDASTWRLTVGLVQFAWSTSNNSLFRFNSLSWERAESELALRAFPFKMQVGQFTIEQTNASDPTSRAMHLHGRLLDAALDLHLERIGNVSQITHLTQFSTRVSAIHLIEPLLQTRGKIALGTQEYGAQGTTYFEHYWTPTSCQVFFRQWWKWIVLRLSNSVQVVVVQSQSTHTALYLMDRRGGRLHAHEGPIKLTPTCTWTSPRSSMTYPVCHRIEAAQIELLVTPLALDSEIYKDQQPALYEGYSQAVGMIHGLHVVGTGTTELRSGRFVAP